MITCYRIGLSGLWEDTNTGKIFAVRNDNLSFGGLVMNPKSKALTFIFGTFEKDSLKRHEKAVKFAEHQLDVIAFDFAPNSAPKTRNFKASIKVDYRFGFQKAETSIS